MAKAVLNLRDEDTVFVQLKIKRVSGRSSKPSTPPDQEDL